MNSRWFQACFAGSVLVFFFVGLGSYDLSAPDEPRFALVAREMLTHHTWLMPHRNEVPYPDKPPFFFWSIAALSALNGGEVNAWTARLPSAIAATLILWIMFQWNFIERERRLRAFLTVFVLMSCAKFFFQARMAQIDMVLCLMTTGAAFIGYKAVRGKPYNALSLGLCLGCGVLAKGPVAFILPVGAMCVFAALSGGREAWRHFPVKGLLWGFLPIFIWLGLLLAEVYSTGQWAYFENLLFKQTVTRYFNAWHHHKPFYYFFVTLLHDFLPWTPIFLMTLPMTKNQRKALEPSQKFAWSFILFTLVFFSLSKGKRGLYILPIYPFAAALVAARIEEMLERGRCTKLETRIWILMGAIIMLAACLTLAWTFDLIHLKNDWIDATRPQEMLVLFSLLLFFSGGLIIYPAIQGSVKLSFAFTVISMLFITILMYSVMLPWVSPFRSAKRFMTQTNRIIHEQDATPVVGMVEYRSAYRFYGDFPLKELVATQEAHSKRPTVSDFWRQYPCGWIIMRFKDWKHLTPFEKKQSTVKLKMRIGRGSQYLLIRKHECGKELKHAQSILLDEK